MPPYCFFGPKCSVGRVLVKDPAISSHTWSTVKWTTFYPNWHSGWCFNCVLCTVLFIKQPVRQKDVLYFCMAQGEIWGNFQFREIILGWYWNALLILVLVVVFFMHWLLVFLSATSPCSCCYKELWNVVVNSELFGIRNLWKVTNINSCFFVAITRISEASH